MCSQVRSQALCLVDSVQAEWHKAVPDWVVAGPPASRDATADGGAGGSATGAGDAGVKRKKIRRGKGGGKQRKPGDQRTT